jgi:oxygen-independent coproporphyrinogen-3 oxidase
MSKGDPATSVGQAATETEVGSVFVSNYPPYSFWRQDLAGEPRRVLGEPADAETPLGLYLHIPFCRKRCKFCYFKVYTDKAGGDVQRYLDALGAELELYAKQPAIQGRPLKFVYVGGGTPSFISSSHLERLVGRLKDSVSWDGAEEVAFECEPGTLTQPKLQRIREVGVTRLSLGVENLDDEILRENGRAHVSKEVYRVMPWIKALGFDQLNVDLIAGMVGETWESWRDSVRKTVELDADSVTIYQMELPFNAVYSRQILDGSAMPVADWATKREWHHYAFEQLAEAGYEISSAYTMVKRERPGRFVYRDSVWRGCDLIGLGVSSFSHVGGVHYQNASRWDLYLVGVESGELPIDRAFATDERERLTREMILQLKTGKLDASYFSQKFNADILQLFGPIFERYEREELLTIVDDGVRLTRKGLLQVDGLLPAFYEEKYQNARYT